MSQLKPPADAASPPDTLGPRGSAPDGTDPLMGLARMSTTAGVGSGDYAAISPLAVVAALLGIASVLAPILNSDVLLAIPLAAIGCAVLAWRQIGRSNGTQSGRAIALTGALLALVIGGGTVGMQAWTYWQYQPDRRAIANIIVTLGQEIAAANAKSPAPTTAKSTIAVSDLGATREYNLAYQLFSDRFHRRVPRDKFVEVWQEMNHQVVAGGVRSMHWNGQIHFFSNTGSGAPMADAVALIDLERAADVPHEGIQFTKASGSWQIEDIPGLFPPERFGAPIGPGY